MNTINPPQLKCLSTLVNKLGIDKEAKQILVQGFSEGRATSSKDLYSDEAAAMIKHLKTLDPQEAKAEKMRRKIISMAHEMGWEKMNTDNSPRTRRPKPDMKRIDEWCKKFGYMKKSLDNHTYDQLPKLVSQFAQGPYRHYISNL